MMEWWFQLFCMTDNTNRKCKIVLLVSNQIHKNKQKSQTKRKQNHRLKNINKITQALKYIALYSEYTTDLLTHGPLKHTTVLAISLLPSS